MIRLLTRFLVLILALGAAAPALAHTRSETHSNWQINGAAVRMSFTVPDLEAARLVAKGAPLPSGAAVAAYLTGHIHVTAAGQACAMDHPVRPTAAVGAVSRYEFSWTCPGDKSITLQNTAFFELVPTHTNMVQIQSGETFVEQLFTQDETSLEVGGAHSTEALKNASFFKYIEMGVMHIFTGVDHQSFLLGLVLLSRRLRDLTFVITGFTIGHSVTLAMAVTGILRPHAEYIDALVGLTIALVGAEALAVNSSRPGTVALATGGLLLLMGLGKLLGLGGLPVLLLIGGGLFSANYLMVSGHLRDAARMRLVVTLVFGLIHGFGFAADLLSQKLPQARLAELLLGFNLGVEIGQLSLVLGVLGLVALLVKVGMRLPRRMVTDFAASFLVGLGLFWFVARSY
jgi:hypothetical protein